MAFDLQSYTDVRTKIELFITKYPQGSLQFEFKGLCDHNHEMIWGIAYAYRTPDDERPGIGVAQELAQGRSNFTRGSELQNLETSCWGRAISSLGIGITTAIASAEEVAAAQGRKSADTEPKATAAQVALIRKHMSDAEVKEYKETMGITGTMTKEQASVLIEGLVKKDGEQG